MDALLVMNAGSSSLKFQIFTTGGGRPKCQIRGQIDGIGVRPRFRADRADAMRLADETLPAADVPDLPAATRRLQDWLATLGDLRLRAVGHRVVHGGPEFAAPVLVDDATLAQLASLESLAPLHQANNLAPIRMMRALSPALPQVACFDTAFHRNHPAVADTYALPRVLRDAGVRRYGFHGLSYAYVAARLAEIAPQLARGRVIVAHLGSGASMCAMVNGRSIDSTMGFTALDGLVMGTRPGQIDPGVVLWLFAQQGLSAAEVSELLYKESGLKGLSGLSSDMRDLLGSGDPAAAFAIDCFIYRAAMQAGGLVAAMGGIDAFVFTAGIGENSPAIRERLSARLGWLGARLDPAANSAGATVISDQASAVPLLIIPTDEELMIARQMLQVLPHLSDPAAG
jgi:acetate kinase